MMWTRKQAGWLVFAGTCVAAAAVHAQGPIVEPKLFGWGEPPSPDVNPPNTPWQGDRYFRRTTEVNLTWGGYMKSLTAGSDACVYHHFGFDAVWAA